MVKWPPRGRLNIERAVIAFKSETSARALGVIWKLDWLWVPITLICTLFLSELSAVIRNVKFDPAPIPWGRIYGVPPTLAWRLILSAKSACAAHGLLDVRSGVKFISGFGILFFQCLRIRQHSIY